MLPYIRCGRFIAFALVFLGLSVNAQNRILSLEDCFRLSLQNNIDIQVSRHLPEVAEADVLLAKSPFDVYLSGSYQYGRTDSRLLQDRQGTFNLGVAKRFSPGTEVFLGYTMQYQRSSDFEDTRDINQALIDYLGSPGLSGDLDFRSLWTSGVTLLATQPLLRNFGIGVNEAPIRAALSGVSAADCQVLLATNQILGKTELAYWGWLLALQNVVEVRASIARAQGYLETVKEQALKVEGILPSDVNEAYVNLHRRESLAIELEKEIRIAQDRLKRLVHPFHPAEPQKIEWDERWEPAPNAVEAFAITQEHSPSFESAWKSRPEIQEIRHQMDAMDALIEGSENQLLPKFDVTGSVSFFGEEDVPGRAFRRGFNGDHNRWQVGVSVEFPLGNRAARGQLQKNQASKALLESKMNQLQYDICLEIREAMHGTRAAREKYDKSLEILSNAEERLRSMERRHKNPLPGDFNMIFFVQDAEIKTTEARISRNQALFECKAALVQLKMAEAIYLRDFGSRTAGN